MVEVEREIQQFRFSILIFDEFLFQSETGKRRLIASEADAGMKKGLWRVENYQREGLAAARCDAASSTVAAARGVRGSREFVSLMLMRFSRSLRTRLSKLV